jgi:D-3-phosphoglycerate dehydrogenase
MDPNAALKFLKGRGIDYLNRETDDKKGFANSITVDLTGSLDASTLRQVSVRGTVAEGVVMISRINDFDKLYFEPTGHVLCYQYKDRPGVVGRIGAALAEANINIEDVRHSHHVPTDQSLVVFRVNKPVPETLLTAVGKEIHAVMSFAVTM